MDMEKPGGVCEISIAKPDRPTFYGCFDWEPLIPG